MALAGTLMIDMRADTARLRNDYDKSKRMTKGYEAGARRSFNNIKKSVFTLKNAIGGLAAVMSVRQIASMAKDSIEFADAIGKTADKLGIGSEALQEFRFVAARTGVDAGVLEKGLQNMVRGIADFSEGTGEAKDALNKLGIEAEDLINLSPDKQFKLIAEELKDVENNTEKISIAYDIFGGRATALINTMNLGTKGIEEMQQSARDAGTVISSELIDKSQILNDQWDTLSETVSTTFTSAVIGAASVFTDLRSESKKQNDEMAVLAEQIFRIQRGSEGLLVKMFGDPGEAEKKIANLSEKMGELAKKINPKEEVTKNKMLNLVGLSDEQIQEIILRDQMVYNLQQDSGQALTTAQIDQIILRDQLIYDLERENQQKLISSEEELRLDAQERKRENLKAYYQEEEEFARQKGENLAKTEEREKQNQIRRGEQGFATMLGNTAGYNKAFFTIQKVYRLSKLAMEAPAAVADAYAWGNSWGGPPAGVAMAGIAGAAMASYAVQLAGASYGGSGSASAGGGGSAVTASTTLGQTSPFENPNITANNQNQGQTIINLVNPVLLSEDGGAQMVDFLSDYVSRTDATLIYNDSRNGQDLQAQ